MLCCVWLELVLRYADLLSVTAGIQGLLLEFFHENITNFDTHCLENEIVQ